MCIFQAKFAKYLKIAVIEWIFKLLSDSREKKINFMKFYNT